MSYPQMLINSGWLLLQYAQLKEMLMAKEAGQEARVTKILNDHREKRFLRRFSHPLSLKMESPKQGKTKRRTFVKPFRFQDFVYKHPLVCEIPIY